MKEFLKKNWLKMLLLIVAAFLFFIMVRSCNPNDNSALFRENDSLRILVKKNNELYNDIVDSVKKQRSKDSLAKVKLFTDLSVAKKNLRSAVDDVNYFISIGDSLKAILDTIGYVKNCDSLSIEVKSLVFSNEELTKQYNETLTRLMIESDSNDSVNYLKDKLYNELSMTTDELIKNNKRLQGDYIKSEKGRVFNKSLNRGLAAAVLVLGITVLLKR